MDVTLTAETGRPLGSRPAGRLRREGKIPGVVYGMGGDAVPVAIEWTELRRALTTDAGVNALIDLQVDGQSNLTLIKDLQRDALKRTVTHVDFLRVDPDASIEVEVAVVLIGEPEVLLREGGLVEQHMNHMLVYAKPRGIPREIEVDVTDLFFDNPIKASSIVLPPDVTSDIDPDELIAAAYLPRGVLADGTDEGAEAAEEGGEAVAAEAPADGE
jgi:large subunit ribosomal protein L25